MSWLFSVTNLLLHTGCCCINVGCDPPSRCNHRFEEKTLKICKECYIVRVYNPYLYKPPIIKCVLHTFLFLLFLWLLNYQYSARETKNENFQSWCEWDWESKQIFVALDIGNIFDVSTFLLPIGKQFANSLCCKCVECKQFFSKQISIAKIQCSIKQHIFYLPRPHLFKNATQTKKKETKRPSKEMQVSIARQLSLQPSTVANYFMNARRRLQDKYDTGQIPTPSPPPPEIDDEQQQQQQQHHIVLPQHPDESQQQHHELVCSLAEFQPQPQQDEQQQHHAEPQQQTVVLPAEAEQLVLQQEQQQQQQPHPAQLDGLIAANDDDSANNNDDGGGSQCEDVTENEPTQPQAAQQQYSLTSLWFSSMLNPFTFLCHSNQSSSGDEASFEGDAGDDRQAAGSRPVDGVKLLHERQAEVGRQVEGRERGAGHSGQQRRQHQQLHQRLRRRGGRAARWGGRSAAGGDRVHASAAAAAADSDFARTHHHSGFGGGRKANDGGAGGAGRRGAAAPTAAAAWSCRPERGRLRLVTTARDGRQGDHDDVSTHPAADSPTSTSTATTATCTAAQHHQQQQLLITFFHRQCLHHQASASHSSSTTTTTISKNRPPRHSSASSPSSVANFAALAKATPHTPLYKISRRHSDHRRHFSLLQPSTAVNTSGTNPGGGRGGGGASYPTGGSTRSQIALDRPSDP